VAALPRGQLPHLQCSGQFLDCPRGTPQQRHRVTADLLRVATRMLRLACCDPAMHLIRKHADRPRANPFRFGDVALGEQFTNRIAELDGLLGDLRSGQNVLILAARRFGKTSLIVAAAERLRKEDVLVAYADLLRVTTKTRFAEALAAALYEGLEPPVGRLAQRAAAPRRRGARVTARAHPFAGRARRPPYVWRLTQAQVGRQELTRGRSAEWPSRAHQPCRLAAEHGCGAPRPGWMGLGQRCRTPWSRRLLGSVGWGVVLHGRSTMRRWRAVRSGSA
jgi:hypothetical protein